jgi:hypothetical protein
MSNIISIESNENVISISSDNNVIEIPAGGNTIEVANQGVQGVPGNGAVWGDIGGTLSDQTDLQAALDAKLTTEDSNIVSLASSGNSSLAYIAGALDTITYVDTGQVTNNTKLFSYTTGLLTGVAHVFDYESQAWTVTTVLSYTTGALTGKTITVNKV